MNIEYTDLPSILIAGLAVRTSNSNEQDSKTALLPKTWERAGQKRYTDSIAAVLTDYESDSNGEYTEVIGHEVATSDELQPGEALVKVSAGKYAKFTASGELPGVVLEAWKQVWKAEADGLIKRSYTADLERYPSRGTVELFIAVE